jgi:hypothetical protein
LWTSIGPPASIRLLLRLCCPVFLASPPQQPGVDFFRAQVVEGRIDERASRKDETVSDQNRVDRQVGGFIPESWIAFAAAALVSQRAVQDFMGERSLKFRWLEFIHEGRVIDNPRAVSRHRWQTSGYQFQPQAERAEKRLPKQELNARPGQLLCRGSVRRLHAALPWSGAEAE